MQTNVVVAVQEINAVADGTAEGSNQPAHRIAHQCNAIIVGNTGTMQDNVQRQVGVLPAAVLVIASTSEAISLRREEDRQEPKVAEEETARVAGGTDFRASMSSMMQRDTNTR